MFLWLVTLVIITIELGTFHVLAVVTLMTITIELGAFHVLVVGYIGAHYH